jgi:UDP-N-acetylmuramyl-tripeptide synthetase
MTTLHELAAALKATLTFGKERGVNKNTELAVMTDVITHDSRRVRPGGVFVAIRGEKTDGNLYVGETLKRGVTAIISDQKRPDDFPGAWLQVANARKALAQAAALIYGYPTRSLQLVGITGTNGKTTTAHLVESIFQAAKLHSALMGTISQRIGSQDVASAFTTPEASDTQAFMRRALDVGCTHAVMEVSSHALELHRADCLEFAAAAFTNLTQDHLDLHGTMENYYAAKRKLFNGSIGERPQRAVINLDDAYGQRLVEETVANALTYSLNQPADLTTNETTFGLDGLHFTATTPLGDIVIDSPLVGRPFAYNILCAIGIGIALGFDAKTIATGINQSRGAAGRFERCSTSADDVTVIVDYAHTPDALTNVLQTVRNAATAGQQVITVMGCGGDRDKTKRPLMGQAAAELSDLVIVTSDNPRSEDPQAILEDIRPGVAKSGKPYEMIVDRREAIFRAITQAPAKAVVMLAGKGHEDYQVLATGKIHFDDREVAREALAARKAV